MTKKVQCQSRFLEAPLVRQADGELKKNLTEIELTMKLSAFRKEDNFATKTSSNIFSVTDICFLTEKNM